MVAVVVVLLLLLLHTTSLIIISNLCKYNQQNNHQYPSTWTKTEFTGNPSIPVIFNAPTTTTTATGNPALIQQLQRLASS